MDLSDRVVLITGGSRIGMSVATEVARRGAHVALSYKNSQANAEKTVAAIQSLNRNAVAIRADLSRGSECKEFVKTSAKTLGRIDVLVNMASLYNKKSFDSLTERDWDLGFTVGHSTRTINEALENAGAVAIVQSRWSSGFGANKIFSANTKKAPVIVLSLVPT